MDKLSEKHWGRFRIGDLFQIRIGKNIDGNKADMTGDIAYVTRKETNNGIDGFINGKNVLLNKDFPVITIGNETAKPYVQQYPFFTGTKVNILKPYSKVSFYALQFVATSLQQHKDKYSYSYTTNSTRLKEQIILLPITESGVPDWAFMDAFMRQKEQKLLKPAVEKLCKRLIHKEILGG